MVSDRELCAERLADAVVNISGRCPAAAMAAAAEAGIPDATEKVVDCIERIVRKRPGGAR